MKINEKYRESVNEFVKLILIQINKIITQKVNRR